MEGAPPEEDSILEPLPKTLHGVHGGMPAQIETPFNLDGHSSSQVNQRGTRSSTFLTSRSRENI